MKQIAEAAIYQRLVYVCAILGIGILGLGALPLEAAAAVVSVQTQQILPPGGNTCAPLLVSNFTPYIYDNALDSFEFTVSDPSYVALIGSVGNTSVPFQFMTRHADASGALRIHVDIMSASVSGTLPVTVTLLSARGAGQPVCIAVVATSVGSGPAQNGSTAGAPATKMNTTSGNSYSHANVGASNTGEITTNKMSNTSGSGTGNTSSVAVSAVGGSLQNLLRNACSTHAGAYRLWLVLLALYVLVMGALLLAEWPASWRWIRMPAWRSTVILVPLVLLLGFWYLSVGCRATRWMLVASLAIALAGFFGVFWNHPRARELILVRDVEAKV